MSEQKQKILGVAGHKQSGKSTAGNFITGLELVSYGIVKTGFVIDELGQLNITDLFGNEDYEGHLDLNRQNPEFLEFLEKEISPYVKIYSFADILKKDICIRILGLKHEQCFGTDEEKNSVTHLKWKDMPGVITDEKAVEEPYMTGRQVLQHVGTNIFRQMYPNVWADATLRQIKEDGSLYAIITDVRFPNEVAAIKEAGGKTFRLTRNENNPDVHESETALDRDKYDWNNFDAIIDNSTVDVPMQNYFVHQMLQDWGWAPALTEAEGS
jgi:hypothetical protein